MRKRRSLPSLVLLAVFLAACGPAAPQSPAASATPIRLEPTATPFVDLTATHVYLDSLNSATPPATPLMVATSRGPNLEATDPTTVRMDSGGLQFVEFFEFW